MMRGRSLMAAAIIAMAGVSTAALAQPAPQVRENLPPRAKKQLFGSGFTVPARRWGYPGVRQTMAQQQRAAKKAKNVRRNRASQRG